MWNGIMYGENDNVFITVLELACEIERGRLVVTMAPDVYDS